MKILSSCLISWSPCQMKTLMSVLCCCATILIFNAETLGENQRKGCIIIGTDENFWFPFTYTKDDRADGLHVRIARQAFKNLNYSVKFQPLPWLRCLEWAKDGKIDGIVSASYTSERAEFLFYPQDAATNPLSKWRLTEVEYVVVSFIKDPFEFKGDLKELPPPIRAPLGYSIVDDLKKQGIKVETARGDINNLGKLIRDKNGVVITLRQIVQFLRKRPRFANTLKVHTVPITSKPYFMPFSKKGKLTKAERLNIWDEVTKIRDDEQLMAEYLLNE